MNLAFSHFCKTIAFFSPNAQSPKAHLILTFAVEVTSPQIHFETKYPDKIVSIPSTSIFTNRSQLYVRPRMRLRGCRCLSSLISRGFNHLVREAFCARWTFSCFTHKIKCRPVIVRLQLGIEHQHIGIDQRMSH